MNINQRQVAAGLLLALLLYSSQNQGCTISPPSRNVTQITYVYEKDQGAVPPAVTYALRQVNETTQVAATAFEKDQRDGDGQIPDQYQVALAAATEAGMPCLVVQVGDDVWEIVDNPQAEDDVLGVLE